MFGWLSRFLAWLLRLLRPRPKDEAVSVEITPGKPELKK
jgi:hypothetical protein